MTSVRIEKSFTRVLNALAELEALSSNEAFPGASAWVARLETRLDHYFAVCGRLAPALPQLNAEQIHSLLNRVKDAIARGDTARIFSASADLREQVVEHFRGLAALPQAASP
jgi:hypothetical protein